MYSPSSATTVTIQPALSILINYHKLIYDYQHGFFNRPIPFHVKLLTKMRSLSIKNTSCTDNNQARFNLPQSNLFLVVTSNHTDYTIMRENIKTVNTCTYRCLYCTRDIMQEKVGIPFICKTRSKRKGDIIYTYQVFYCHGNFCNYNCAWTYLINHNRCNPEYFTAMSNLICLVKLLHPTKKLHVLPHPSFLIINGGSMSNEEFDEEELHYLPHPAVILAPFKTTNLLAIK